MRSEFEKWYSNSKDKSASSAFAAGWMCQQSKIDELQKRVDACQKLLSELKESKAELIECDLYDKGVGRTLYSVIHDLEQALKGGEA